MRVSLLDVGLAPFDKWRVTTTGTTAITPRSGARRCESILARGLACLALALAAACASSKERPPARTAAQCVEKGAKTGVAGAKTGVVTGVEGVKTFGKAVGGFVEGGSEGARREWNEGKADTKKAARQGAADVKKQSHAEDCR